MGCHGNNATPPAPAVAPGSELIDATAVAREARIDPRVSAAIPGFDAPFLQAGLAGYSDAAMRIVARRLGCPCCVTEALLDRTLLAGGRGFDKADLGELHDNVPGGEEDHPLVGQIMGSDPDEMAIAAVKMIEQGTRGASAYRAMAYGVSAPSEFPPPYSPGRGGDRRDAGVGPGHRVAMEAAPERSFQAIDVNLACPVKKISSKARGGHWLREPQGAIDILRAVREAVPSHIPVTVKLRRGSDDSSQAERNFERVFASAYEIGCAWTTVHGRTVEQKYVGPSRWTFLRDLVRRHPDKIVFGSGDVWGVDDIFRMIAYTGVHAVSVARGCIGNPWIFRQARQMMAGQAPTAPTLEEQRDVLEQHFTLSAAVNGERRAGTLMRKFGVRFAAHHPRAEEARLRFIAVSSVDDWRAVMNELYGEAAGVAPSA